ncbi:alpha-tocopherol transfer protein-like [Cydia strobilella]|uniref:alpha-tocopherol transfer protein-like n=1 Tax=Cydia strobilella TaxID=1100964 RepID=UPI003007B8B9
MDNAEGIRQAIELLRNWMQKQEYFNKKDQSDTYFEKLLVVSKGSLERSKIRLEKICTLRTIWPMYFTLKDFNYFTEDFKTYNSVHLRDVTEDGSRVSLSKVKDTKTLTSDLLIRFVTYAVITCEYAMAHDYPNGLVAILDFRDVNLIDLLAFSTRHFTLLQQCLTILKDGYGMRLKGLHVLTMSKATDALVTFAKQLLPKKLAGRLHVHRDMDTLYNFVPKEILPSDLGGDALSLSELHETFINELFSKEHKEWMEEGNRATMNLSKQPKDYFSDDYISISGSFRSLTVD